MNNGGVNTTFDLGATGDLTTRNTAIINIGAITGTGSLSGSSGATGKGTFSIGGKGTDSTFNGVITDSAASRFADLIKVGSGSLTLGGNKTCSGALTDNGLTFGSMPAIDPGTSFALDTATPGQVNLVLVPEPGSLLLALLAGVGVMVRRRS